MSWLKTFALVAVIYMVGVYFPGPGNKVKSLLGM